MVGYSYDEDVFRIGDRHLNAKVEAIASATFPERLTAAEILTVAE
jgi:hypothetical protein